MKPYYYIKGLRVIEKFYNSDRIDYFNIKNNNFYMDKYRAIAEVENISSQLSDLKNKLA